MRNLIDYNYISLSRPREIYYENKKMVQSTFTLTDVCGNSFVYLNSRNFFH